MDSRVTTTLTLTLTLTRYLREAGYNTDKIWDKIRALLVKSLLTVQPHLSHTYHALVCHTGLEP